MSKSANRRVFRRRTAPDQTPGEPKRRWWRRRQTPDVGESPTLSPTSVNHPGSGGPRLLDARSSSRQRVQRIRLREQRDQGNRIREWLQDRAHAADKRRKKAKAGQDIGSRGVDRVPDRLKVRRTLEVPPPLPDPVMTRKSAAAGVAEPYRNPDRIHRLAKSGRLRAELREQG